MDLRVFVQKTTGAADVGELLFVDGFWRVKVQMQDGNKYLLNLAGEYGQPLWRVHDDTSDVAVGLSEGFRWYADGEVTTGAPLAPKHLGLTITPSGPAIIAVSQGRHLFFAMDGKETGGYARGSLTFMHWSAVIRRDVGNESWKLLQVSSPSAND